MLVVIPLSKSDKILSDSFCNILNFFGPYLNHEILFTYKKNDKELVDSVKKKICHLFKKSQDCIVSQNAKTGWPQGPNAYWKETIAYLKSINNKNPWYWMESDVTPVKEGWLDEMEYDYYHNNKPFLGCVSEASFNYPFHLSGCAIYPPNISDYTNNWKWIHNSNAAFDIVCSVEIMRYQVFDSYKMLNYFQTQKYKLDSGRFFSFEKRYIPFDVGRQKDIEKKEIEINKTLVVHGCKDGSLSNVIIYNYDLLKSI
jgi:hypothetical protein